MSKGFVSSDRGTHALLGRRPEPTLDIDASSNFLTCLSKMDRCFAVVRSGASIGILMTINPHPAPVARPSNKRELNKADKLARIRDAARTLFAEEGYEGAALRAVAARSGVGFGTLFDYASNKRDLLFLVFVPDLHDALNEGSEAAAKENAYLDQIMSVFEAYYKLYGREPTLSRDMLRELNFYRQGRQASLFIDQRAEFLETLTALTRRAQASGQLAPSFDAHIAGQLLLSTFAWEVRRWLSAEPLDIEEGLVRLRELLDLQIAGLRPAGAAL